MLKHLKEQAQKGFTIIEVMIVLAIAGLILVVVLVAVPQLQRSQRDSNRENIVSRVSTEVSNYASNNNGRLPFQSSTTVDDFEDRYLDGEVDIANPQTGNDYSVDIADQVTDPPTEDQILVYPGGSCSGESVTGSLSGTSRQYAMRVAFEAGDVFFCIDNN